MTEKHTTRKNLCRKSKNLCYNNFQFTSFFYYVLSVSEVFDLPRWPCWLDRCALFSASAPGCGMSVVQGPEGARVGSFSSWGTAVYKGFLTETAYFSLRVSHSAMSKSSHLHIRVNPCCTDERTLREKSASLIRLPFINIVHYFYYFHFYVIYKNISINVSVLLSYYAIEHVFMPNLFEARHLFFIYMLY